jgi:hypothetical protein
MAKKKRRKKAAPKKDKVVEYLSQIFLDRPEIKPPDQCWVIVGPDGGLCFFDETLLIFSAKERAQNLLDSFDNAEKCEIKQLPWTEICLKHRNYDGAMLDWLGVHEGVAEGGGHIQFPSEASLN